MSLLSFYRGKKLKMKWLIQNYRVILKSTSNSFLCDFKPQLSQNGTSTWIVIAENCDTVGWNFRIPPHGWIKNIFKCWRCAIACFQCTTITLYCSGRTISFQCRWVGFINLSVILGNKNFSSFWIILKLHTHYSFES